MRDSEYTRALIEAVTARPGYSSYVGAKVGRVCPEGVEMILDRKPELLQPSGYFHGGVISGLADHAAGAAVTTALPQGRFCLTVNLNMTFLAPADGHTLIARARPIKVTSTLGTAEVTVFTGYQDADERLCAVATATMRAIDMPTKGRPIP